MIDRDTVELPMPPPLRACIARLTVRGHDAWIVGESLHALLRGERPDRWSVATAASPAQIAGCYGQAVPVRRGEATFVVPGSSGPIDVSTHRNGRLVEDDLARRDFGVLAMAWSPESGQLLDPYSGRRDLEQRVLRSVGQPDQSLAVEPLRALRAGRLMARYGYTVDDALERAISSLPAASIRSIAAADSRRELKWLLLGPHAGEALSLLQRAGVETALGAKTRPDAPALVDTQPADLALRLAAWLRGAGGARVLRRLRMGQPLSAKVLLLLAHHPIEQSSSPRHPSSLRRLTRRLEPELIESLIELRRCELALGQAGSERVATARADLEALQKRLRELAEAEAKEREAAPLALDGEQIMRALEIGPGPTVGRALRYLREQVAREPTCNSPDCLRALLEAWSDPGGQPAYADRAR